MAQDHPSVEARPAVEARVRRARVRRYTRNVAYVMNLRLRLVGRDVSLATDPELEGQVDPRNETYAVYVRVNVHARHRPSLGAVEVDLV